MLHVDLYPDTGICVFEPRGPLSKSDFESASLLVDSYIRAHGPLRGLIIKTREFPGWDSFGALVSHVLFVGKHHKLLSHVAIVTDSSVGDLAERLGGHFVSAQVRHFPFDEFNAARDWILGDKGMG
jgi:hypothetical protein